MVDMPAVFQRAVWNTCVWSCAEDDRRYALAEIGGVGELGNTVGAAAAADEAGHVVAGIVDPGRVELRTRPYPW